MSLKGDHVDRLFVLGSARRGGMTVFGYNYGVSCCNKVVLVLGRVLRLR